jgi:trehalose-6-phosphatase
MKATPTGRSLLVLIMIASVQCAMISGRSCELVDRGP